VHYDSEPSSLGREVEFFLQNCERHSFAVDVITRYGEIPVYGNFENLRGNTHTELFKEVADRVSAILDILEKYEAAQQEPSYFSFEVPKDFNHFIMVKELFAKPMSYTCIKVEHNGFAKEILIPYGEFETYQKVKEYVE
jgi:hypothetical protein